MTFTLWPRIYTDSHNTRASPATLCSWLIGRMFHARPLADKAHCEFITLLFCSYFLTSFARFHANYSANLNGKVTLNDAIFITNSTLLFTSAFSVSAHYLRFVVLTQNYYFLILNCWLSLVNVFQFIVANIVSRTWHGKISSVAPY